MAIKKLTIKPNTQLNSYKPYPSYVYKGFSSKKKDSNFKIYDIECIREDVLNQFNIRKGERVMNPNFGTIIWDSIFEPLNELTKEAIVEDIKTILSNEPRIIVQDVKVDEYASGILLEITVRYRTNDLTGVIKLQFDRELGLISS